MLFERLRKTLYCRIDSEAVSMRLVGAGREIIIRPEIAVDAGKRVTGVGESAQGAPGSVVYRPFSHEQLVLEGVEHGGAILRHMVVDLLGRGPLLRPFILIHPLRALPGGLGDIEVAALVDMATFVGAAEVLVWSGAPLSDAVIENRQFADGERGTVHCWVKHLELKAPPRRARVTSGRPWAEERTAKLWRRVGWF